MPSSRSDEATPPIAGLDPAIPIVRHGGPRSAALNGTWPLPASAPAGDLTAACSDLAASSIRALADVKPVEQAGERDLPDEEDADAGYDVSGVEAEPPTLTVTVIAG